LKDKCQVIENNERCTLPPVNEFLCKVSVKAGDDTINEEIQNITTCSKHEKLFEAMKIEGRFQN
jgi:hypothetical protein